MATWRVATLRESRLAAENIKTLVFDVPGIRHEAGQHYDIRLTAEDGYQAERSYSAANAPEPGVVELGVELLPDGEVSPYLWQMQPGEKLELRGPIGGHFVWDVSMPGPLCLIGGGSGMVPLVAMSRLHAKNRDRAGGRKIVFLASTRTSERVPYLNEIEEYERGDKNFSFFLTLTETRPEGFHGYGRRIDAAMIREVFGEAFEGRFYVCGPTPFVEAAAGILVDVGVPPERVRTERFGGISTEE